MATINYFIQSKNNPAGIYVRLREGRDIDAKAKTKYAINPADWSTSKGQPKSRDVSFKQLNADLTDLRSDLLNYFNKSVGNRSINTQWLKEFITPPAPPELAPNKLVEYFDYYASHKKNDFKSASLKKLYVNKRLIERFQKATKKEYLIADVNAAFKLNFEEYCKKEKYSQNTIARAMKFIKTICYHAKSNKIETDFQLDEILIKNEVVDKIFLTPDEIEKIQNEIFEHDYLNNARDWLIISCETGQRVSDFMRFTKEQIRIEGEVSLIEFTQTKTSKIMSIPLSPRAATVLKKRKGDFPRKISDVKYNVYIKEVCKLAGLNHKIKGGKLNKETHRKESGAFPKHELVTSHIGRKSFATNNYGRIPTPLLMNVTGHTTETSFLQYIGKTSTDLAIQLADYF